MSCHMIDQYRTVFFFSQIYVSDIIDSFICEMNWLVLLIFLVKISCSFSLLCRTTGDGDPITLTFAEFSITDLYDEINGLDLTECMSSIDESNCFCRTEFFINHGVKEIKIQLTEHLFDHDLLEELIRIDTLIRAPQRTDIYVVHFLEYACSFEGCEEIYFNESQHVLNWFIENDLADLKNEVIRYMFDDDKEVTGSSLNTVLSST